MLLLQLLSIFDTGVFTIVIDTGRCNANVIKL